MPACRRARPGRRVVRAHEAGPGSTPAQGGRHLRRVGGALEPGRRGRGGWRSKPPQRRARGAACPSLRGGEPEARTRGLGGSCTQAPWPAPERGGGRRNKHRRRHSPGQSPAGHRLAARPAPEPRPGARPAGAADACRARSAGARAHPPFDSRAHPPAIRAATAGRCPQPGLLRRFGLAARSPPAFGGALNIAIIPAAFCPICPRRRAMTATDELLKNNEAFADGFDKGDLPIPPAKKVAVVACMDARVNPYPILGLELGDAHVIRSLAISQRLLGTEEVILIHHTDCGMLTFNDDEFRRQIQEDTGIKPPWSAESFSDLEDDVRQSIERIKASPFIPNKDAIRGFVYEVETGRLREVA